MTELEQARARVEAQRAEIRKAEDVLAAAREQVEVAERSFVEDPSPRHANAVTTALGAVRLKELLVAKAHKGLPPLVDEFEGLEREDAARQLAEVLPTVRDRTGWAKAIENLVGELLDLEAKKMDVSRRMEQATADFAKRHALASRLASKARMKGPVVTAPKTGDAYALVALRLHEAFTAGQPMSAIGPAVLDVDALLQQVIFLSQPEWFPRREIPAREQARLLVMGGRDAAQAVITALGQERDREIENARKRLKAREDAEANVRHERDAEEAREAMRRQEIYEGLPREGGITVGQREEVQP